MADSATGSVVITGASRGLGLATAAHLHRQGWTVLACMRTPDVGLKRLRAELGAGLDEKRLLSVRLDLDDPSSVRDAGETIRDAVGAPTGVVHNAGVAGVGCVEEMPIDVVEQIITTNLLGPIRLTQELLPSMREAGRGRIVVVSSQGGIRGMPGISAYSASKGALERWAESLALEISPFGLGVTALVAGTFRTDILERTHNWKDDQGPYAEFQQRLESAEPRVLKLASPPSKFAPAVERALLEHRPFARHAVGTDAKLMLYVSRVTPGRFLPWAVRRALGLPAPSALRLSAASRRALRPVDQRDAGGR